MVKGPTNYDEIKTINVITHLTFHAAYDALGLLGDDRESHEALDEVSHWEIAYELRQLFVTLIVYYQVANPNKLLEMQ